MKKKKKKKKKTRRPCPEPALCTRAAALLPAYGAAPARGSALRPACRAGLCRGPGRPSRRPGCGRDCPRRQQPTLLERGARVPAGGPDSRQRWGVQQGPG